MIESFWKFWGDLTWKDKTWVPSHCWWMKRIWKNAARPVTLQQLILISLSFWEKNLFANILSGYLKYWSKICENNPTFQHFWIPPWVQCGWAEIGEVEKSSHNCQKKQIKFKASSWLFDSLSWTLWIYFWLLWIGMNSPWFRRIRFQSRGEGVMSWHFER